MTLCIRKIHRILRNQIYKNLGDQDNQQAWMMQMQKDLAAAVDSSRNQSQQQNQ